MACNHEQGRGCSYGGGGNNGRGSSGRLKKIQELPTRKKIAYKMDICFHLGLHPFCLD